ncbi:hypothetical protein Tco_0558791 [Tanacetum coccineum]
MRDFGNGYPRKGQKSKPKRQNRAREQKERKEKLKSKPSQKVKVNKVKSKSTPGSGFGNSIENRTRKPKPPSGPGLLIRPMDNLGFAFDLLREALSAAIWIIRTKLEEPMKDQPLSADASPTALSPGHIADSNPEEDKEDPEEDPADHPANGFSNLLIIILI